MDSEDISFLYKLTKNEKAYKLSDKLSGELLGYIDEGYLASKLVTLVMRESCD